MTKIRGIETEHACIVIKIGPHGDCKLSLKMHISIFRNISTFYQNLTKISDHVKLFDKPIVFRSGCDSIDVRVAYSIDIPLYFFTFLVPIWYQVKFLSLRLKRNSYLFYLRWHLYS